MIAIICMLYFCLHVSTPQSHLVPVEPEEGVKSPGTEVSDSCELPCVCWELNPGHLSHLRAHDTVKIISKYDPSLKTHA